MSEIYIFGHKSPDTDSICAAIAYEELKNQIDENTHVACRLGSINRETEYVLNKFGVTKPPLIADVNPQIRDAQYYPVVPLKETDTIKNAWHRMKETELTLVPVIDNEGIMTGIVSSQDITEAYIELVDPCFLKTYSISMKDVADTLGAQVLCGNSTSEDVPEKLVIYNHPRKHIHAGDLVIAGSDVRSVNECIDSIARYIIISGNFSYSEIEKIKELGNLRGKTVLYINESIFAITRIIAQALPVKSVMKQKDIVAFSPNSKIDDVSELMLRHRYRYFPVVDALYRPLGLISRRHLLTYKQKQVILVDHNEKGQTADGIEKSAILEIVDHHRLGDLQTGKPLFINCKAVGSTCTIVAEQFKLNGIVPTEKTAALMLSAIISDTLLFRSPTCTQQDKETAEYLAEICGLSLYDYGQELLRAGASIDNYTDEDIIHNDSKLYEIGRYRISTCQILTTDISNVLCRLDGIKEAAEEFAAKKGYDCVLLIATDFIRYGSQIFAFGNENKKVLEALGADNAENTFLDGVISRKSQIIPQLVLNLRK